MTQHKPITRSQYRSAAKTFPENPPKGLFQNETPFKNYPSSTSKSSYSVYAYPVHIDHTDPPVTNKYLLDSGASHHLMPSIEYLTTITSQGSSATVSGFDGRSLPATATGTLTLRLITITGESRVLTLNNVLVVPGLTVPLLSAKLLTKSSGAKVIIAAGHTDLLLADNSIIRCLDIRGTDFLPVLAHTAALATITTTPGATTSALNAAHTAPTPIYDLHGASPPAITTGANAPPPSLALWHARLGHTAIPRIIKFGTTIGITLNERDTTACHLCHQYKARLPNVGKTPYIHEPTKAVDMCHADLFGPLDPVGYDGTKYLFAFRDDKTGFIWVYRLRSKEARETTKVLHEFYTTHPTVTSLRCDRGKEYTAQQFVQACASHNITLTFRATDMPHRHGYVERCWGHITRCAATMLAESNAPRPLWPLAFDFATMLANCLPSSSHGDTSAYFRLFQTQPLLHKVRRWGSIAYRFLPKDERDGKLSPTAAATVLVGYSPTFKSCIVFNPQTRVAVPSEIARIVERPFYRSASTSSRRTGRVDLIAGHTPDPHPITDVTTHVAAIENENHTPHGVTLTHTLLTCTARAATLHSSSPSWAQALRSPERNQWLAADHNESENMRRNHAFGSPITRSALPPGCHLLRMNRVTKIKRDNSFKIRWVVDGSKMEAGTHYDAGCVEAPVVRTETTRLVLAIAATNALHTFVIDATAAFTQADLPRNNIYVIMPPGYAPAGRSEADTSSTVICQLLRSVYGLKQAAFLWYQKLTTVLLGYGMRKSALDSCLWIKGDLATNTLIICCTYVDDCWFVCSDATERERIHDVMSASLEVTPPEDLNNSMGLTILISPDRRTIKINQSKYITQLLHNWGMTDCTPAHTPMAVSTELIPATDAEHDEAKGLSYRSLIGAINWAVTCAPELSHAATILSRFLHKWSKAAYQAGMHVLRYLKGRPTLSITYTANCEPRNHITAYCDANFGEHDGRRSTGCFITYLAGGITNITARRMRTVAKSTTEAETSALASAVSAVLYQRAVLQDLTVHPGSGLQVNKTFA